MPDRASSLSRYPKRRLAVLTCMDCRIDAIAALGLEVGDAHVLRNAGGIVTEDALRSLALSKHALRTEEIWVVQHTECGMLGLDDEEFLGSIEEETGERPEWTPGGFATLTDSVAEGLMRLASEPALADSKIHGYVLDIATGELTEISPARAA